MCERYTCFSRGIKTAWQCDAAKFDGFPPVGTQTNYHAKFGTQRTREASFRLFAKGTFRTPFRIPFACFRTTFAPFGIPFANLSQPMSSFRTAFAEGGSAFAHPSLPCGAYPLALQDHIMFPRANAALASWLRAAEDRCARMGFAGITLQEATIDCWGAFF